MNTFLLSFIRHTVFVNVLMVCTIVMGLVASQNMIREMFPETSVDTIMVAVPYPGADPEEVEEGISRKLEEAIDGVEGIKRLTTVSYDNMARAVVEVKEGADLDDVYTDVRNKIDTISTFPLDAEEPSQTEITIMTDVLILSLWGDHSEKVLKEMAEDLKDELQDLPSVSQVAVSGARDYEISIELSEERLREYGLTLAEVSAAVSRGSLNLSGGTLRTKGEEIRLRTMGRNYTAKDFASVVVMAKPDGEIITLDRIAQIKDGFTDDELVSRFNGHPAVLLTVQKTPEEDAIAIVKEVREFVERKRAELPAGFNFTVWSDLSKQIEDRISMLVRNGLMGLMIVFLSLWLFLDLRLSFWTAMGIPISLSGAMVLMWLMGSTINQFSLFGLIMVLGIVVDDAIVVGEAIYVHRKNGDPPLLAAINGVKEVGLPVLGAVTTTIVAFMPLFFIGGVMGKFVGIIPVAVVAALVVSIVESLLMLPSHLSHLPDMSEKPSSKMSLFERLRRTFSHSIEAFVDNVYTPFVHRALHYRYISLSVAIAALLLTFGLIGGGHVKFVVFPDLDANDIVASIEFPEGTPIEITKRALVETEDALMRLAKEVPEIDGIPLIKNVHTVAGQGGAGEMPGFGGATGPHAGSIRVELAESENRSIRSKDLLVKWEAETGLISGALSQTFKPLDFGPPGSPISIDLRGQDIDVLRAVSEEIKAELRTYDGVYQVEDSFRPGKNEMRFSLKPEARTMGITLEDLARQVYAGYYGQEALRLQRGRDDIRVRVRYTEDERSQLADLENVRIRTAAGYEVPLFSVANVEFDQGVSSITRVNGRKSVTVMAENDDARANADQVLANLADGLLPKLEQKYAGLFTWDFEGPKRDAREAFSSLAYGFPAAMFGIYIIVATIFRSYVQPLAIMVTIPFGIIGAVMGHLVMGYTINMFSIFGMVALAGVVVNDAIVLIEAINSQIAAGVPVMEAIARGGGRRFRAIILTTLSTVGGLLPLILERDLQAQFVIPMALSIASGVAFATLLTLVFLPCLMVILNDFRRISYWMFARRWPTPEEVEPARNRNLDPAKLAEIQGATLSEPLIAK